MAVFVYSDFRSGMCSLLCMVQREVASTSCKEDVRWTGPLLVVFEIGGNAVASTFGGGGDF